MILGQGEFQSKHNANTFSANLVWDNSQKRKIFLFYLSRTNIGRIKKEYL